MNKDNLNITIQWAEDYIKEFNKNYCINPFIFYEEPRVQRKQQLYIECINYLKTIEELTEEHRKILNKINAM